MGTVGLMDSIQKFESFSDRVQRQSCATAALEDFQRSVFALICFMKVVIFTSWC